MTWFKSAATLFLSNFQIKNSWGFQKSYYVLAKKKNAKCGYKGSYVLKGKRSLEHKMAGHCFAAP